MEVCERAGDGVRHGESQSLRLSRCQKPQHSGDNGLQGQSAGPSVGAAGRVD